MRIAFCCTFFSAFFSLILATFLYLLASNHQNSETERYSVYQLFAELSHVVQERAEDPKAPSPGHRPGYNGNQQGAL